MGQIIRSPDAEEDLVQIGLFIAQDSMVNALAMLDRIDKQLRFLAEFPGAGPSREELGPGLRSFPVGKYLIFYRKIADGIAIVRVLHGARDLRAVLRRFRQG